MESAASRRDATPPPPRVAAFTPPPFIEDGLHADTRPGPAAVVVYNTQQRVYSSAVWHRSSATDARSLATITGDLTPIARPVDCSPDYRRVSSPAFVPSRRFRLVGFRFEIAAGSVRPSVRRCVRACVHASLQRRDAWIKMHFA